MDLVPIVVTVRGPVTEEWADKMVLGLTPPGYSRTSVTYVITPCGQSLTATYVYERGVPDARFD